MKLFDDYMAYIKNNPQRYWFKRKLYGWGWTPATWQGWAVLAVFAVGIFIDAFFYLQQDKPVEYFLVLAVLVGAVIGIAYKKGEKPKWQWGPPSEPKEHHE